MKVFEISRIFPADYNPPNRNVVSSPFLDTMYDVNWNREIRTLLDDYRLFGISLFRDRETIKTAHMDNALAAVIHNPFAFLDVFDCLNHCSEGG